MISLFILLMTLTGTTYAWFKINSNATVSGFNFTVTGGEGYQISLNGDEDSYSDHLTAEDMRMAILCGYNSNYTVKNRKLYYNGSEISDADAKATIKNVIQLSPVTPRRNSNGTFTFENQYGQPIQTTSGKFIEFSIYVKANGLLQDRNEYELYLLGSDEKEVVTSGNDLITLARSSIRSLEVNTITLKNSMRTHGVDLVKGNTIQVYTANALRFSIGDDYQDLGDDNNGNPIKHTNQIFEISDDKDHDLGSYATTYKKENDTSTLSEEQKQELDDMYNADENAMFTYYNNIRPYNKLTKMDYADKPNTITKLLTQQEIKNGGTPYKFVSVKSGYRAKRVTFRFWLEGWDADCFDGISSAIRVNLSFSSFKNGEMTKIR